MENVTLLMVSCHHVLLFSQPKSVLNTAQCIFLIQATNTVCVVTSTAALARYFLVLRGVCQCFGIHDRGLGFSESLPLPTAIERLQMSLDILNGMVEFVRIVLSKPRLSPEGPAGTPAFTTINQFRLSLRSLDKLCSIINPTFVDFLKLQSLLTLVVEHHFSIARSKYPLPTALQYCQMILPVLKDCRYSYFLSQIVLCSSCSNTNI